MHPDEAVIRRLYAALADADGDAMAACYAPDARFADPVFPDLRGPEVGAMWRMLCARSRGLTLKVRDVTTKSGFGSATWEADYVFTRTGRTVHNVGQARFALRDGSITQHMDAWDFHRWAGQALGVKGKALGWTKPFQTKVQDEARDQLAAFMAKDVKGA